MTEALIHHNTMQWESCLKRDTLDKFVPLTLTQIRNGEVPENRRVRIFAEGVYDLFHIGHVESLRQAKEAFPDVELVVGVCSDEDVLKFKGGRTVMSFEERKRAVKTCRYVDEVVDNHPFFFPLEYLDRVKCDILAHDDLPYSTGGAALSNDVNDDFYAQFKVERANGNLHHHLASNKGSFFYEAHGSKVDRFIPTLRTEGISTTDIIQRILDGADEFMDRNKKRSG